MKKFFFPLAMLLALGVAMVPAGDRVHADDFIDLDLTNVAPATRGIFRRAEQFWESRIQGYSDSLPANIRSQLTGRLQITAETIAIDGVGGILGQAGPDTIAQSAVTIGNPADGRVHFTTVPLTGTMSFDIFDAGRADFESTVFHEMAHVLGFGTLWTLNGINDGANNQGLLQARPGGFQYVGRNALLGFRSESGHHRANYVPTENGGGAGTALGHWAGGTSPNWFFAPANGSRAELMTGFATGAPSFVSEATWGAMADVGWAVEGINPNDGSFTNSTFGTSPFPKSYRGAAFNQFSAVPEPSSIAFIGLGMLGLIARRKRA
ncbi:PEP-CTERM sorting domain-containing protein [Mariniblastus fucicola]|uniref:PEP-CTERM motif protein n=1 Tax=Mariniblastus fucicola TaxID=980251 RepID=A0A5B9PAC2_9BACT|nr:PEP-CTERM sorting domain-containing protein [Mariniblastus fucicola]QEG22175.1 PEP-CTERM motif protein [Mariniblastus fucicola]